MTLDFIPQPNTADSPPSTFFLLRVLRKRWPLGLTVLLLTVAATIFYTMGQTRTYRASASIQIDPTPPRPLGNQVQAVVDMGTGNYWNNKEYFITQQKILEGRTIARDTAKALNLHRDASFMQLGHASAKTKSEIDLDDATAVLMSRLTIEPIRDSRLVNVHFIDADPARARRVLSTLIDRYLERNVDVFVASSGASTEWLRDQLKTLKQELESSELALHEYKKEKQILSVSLDDQSNMLRGEMQQLTEALTRVNTKREELQARSRELDKVSSDDPSDLPATELLSNQLLTGLRADYTKSRSELSALLGEGKGEKHPGVAAAAARVDITKQALLAEVRNIQAAVRGDLTATSRESQGLAGLFGQAKQRAMDLNMLEIEYHRLERTKTNTEKLYSLVLERSKESDLTGLQRFNNISIVEMPTVPRAFYRPRISVNVSVGLLVGLVLGLLAAIGRERFDQTLRTPQDIQDEVDLPLLGMLPMISGDASASTYYSRRRRHSANKVPLNDSSPELLVHEAPSSNVAECARSIRTSLMFASPDKPFRKFLVTSGGPGEGKTTIACAVAIAFAQVGQRVLLIDCDLRRPRLHRVMHKDNALGVTTILQNPSDFRSAIHDTPISNLSLITAGPHVPNPAELVQSESFARLLETLGAEFDKIILDSPPVLAVTDASVMASLVDTTLLVARSGKTRRDELRQVIRKLHELRVPLVGLILNALQPNGKSLGYYYPYPYYGYGRRYDSTTSSEV